MIWRLIPLLATLLLSAIIPLAAESLLDSEIDRRPSKKLFLGANWKCTLEYTREVDELSDNLNQMWESLSSEEKNKVELCVNPPFVFLDRVRSRLTKDISVGSQNLYDARGPNVGNTGTTTANMIRAVGSEWVLLGHSDRRNNLGETDKLISTKVKESLSAGLGVILTIGELPHQRRWGLALATLRKQLRAAMKGIEPDEWHRVVVAYEPVWAVGEGATPCSPEEAQRINFELRAFITKHVNADAASACRLTYTGSVNEKNAAAYASLVDVDGFVVGRAGLDTSKLKSIIQTLASAGESTTVKEEL
jgi:triosephosphate isomerase